MKCWNCDTEIVKSEQWTPKNRIWIENPEGAAREHDFGYCYKEKKDRERLGKYAYLAKIPNISRRNERWNWQPYENENKGWKEQPEEFIKHYQSILEFGKCVFAECYCHVIDSWKSKV